MDQTADQLQQIALPDPSDVEADAQIVLAITEQQRAVAMHNAAFWQAAHAQLLAKHNQVVQQLTQRILEASQQSDRSEGAGEEALGGSPPAP